MAIRRMTTKDAKAKGINVLVYGRPGVGKTVLCSTAPKPIIISIEGGLLSLSDKNIPTLEIDSFADLEDLWDECSKKKFKKKYDTICIDSLTDIADNYLAELLEVEKDPRKAYGRMATDIKQLIRKFLDISGVNIYVTAQSEKSKSDDDGEALFTIQLPGNMLSASLPYMFDEVLPLRITRASDDDDEEGFRYLQTQPDYRWDAKDRSGKLKPVEEPHLTKIFKTITT